MRNLLWTAASILIGIVSVADAGPIGICTTWSYADGGIYCRLNRDGVCVSDLGDFPTSVSFPWYVEWSEDGSLHLVRNIGNREYVRYRDHVYIDTSPGAFAPLRFTPDNSTLSPGETSFAWSAAYGIILWTPTGNLRDATPNSEGTVSGQGFQWVEVPGYPGLQQAYWNQTMWEDVYAGRAYGGYLAFCHGEYSGTVTQGDRP